MRYSYLGEGWAALYSFLTYNQHSGYGERDRLMEALRRDIEKAKAEAAITAENFNVES